MDVRVGLWRRLSAEELMLLNCGIGEDSWESLDCKEIQPVRPKGDQSRIFIGRTDAEAETPILWPPDAKNWLVWKDPDAGKDWRQEEKGTTEDEMVRWHHQLNGHGFGWTPGVSDRQGGLACYSPWGHKELDMTEQLNWTEPIPSPADLPDPGIQPGSPALQADSLLPELWSPLYYILPHSCLFQKRNSKEPSKDHPWPNVPLSHYPVYLHSLLWKKKSALIFVHSCCFWIFTSHSLLNI